jgi:hypothetical protein
MHHNTWHWRLAALRLLALEATMADANAQQEQYISEELSKLNPEVVFNNAATYGSKFGIYFTWKGVDTAVFEPVKNRQLWQTDAAQFKKLADDCIAKVAGYIKR